MFANPSPVMKYIVTVTWTEKRGGSLKTTSRQNRIQYIYPAQN
jgi:hypothetical protein